MKASEQLTLIGLCGLFLAELVLAAQHLPDMSPVLLAALGLAAFRGGRAVAFNGIFKWLRDWIGIVESADSSGAGNSNNAPATGAMKAIQELICCPICTGTHAASACLAVYALAPSYGMALIFALAAAGIAEILHWSSESLEWSGRFYREESGSHWLHKNGYIYRGGQHVPADPVPGDNGHIEHVYQRQE